MRAHVFAIGVLMLPGQVVAFENEPNGFRGIKWGESFSAHSSEMVLERENKKYADTLGALKYYRRKGDALAFGGAKLKEITYGYADGRFFAVHVTTSGAVNKEALMDAFLQQFGQPDVKYVWGSIKHGEWPDTTIEVVCNGQRAEECIARLTSNRILKEAEAQTKNVRNEGRTKQLQEQ